MPKRKIHLTRPDDYTFSRCSRPIRRLDRRANYRKTFNQPQLRISLEMFAVEGDGRLPGSEGVSDEAGENMDHGVHGRPVA